MPEQDLSQTDLVIESVSDIALRQALGAQLDPIFFAASATQSFADEQTKAEFRERWFGRYLKDPQDVLLIAREATDKDIIAGYLVGSFLDPAEDSRFEDIGYFKTLAALTQKFSAHLHINLDSRYRNRGIGSRLIERFVDVARSKGCCGVHIVTGGQSRNISFYQRNGFTYRHNFKAGAVENAFLGRALETD